MAPPAALPYLWHTIYFRVHAADIRGESAMPLFPLAGHRSPHTCCGHLRRARHAAIHSGTLSISSYALRTSTASPSCRASSSSLAWCRLPPSPTSGMPPISAYVLRTSAGSPPCRYSSWRAIYFLIRAPNVHGEPAMPLFILARCLFPRTRSERPRRAHRAALRLPRSHGAACRPPHLWHAADLRTFTASPPCRYSFWRAVYFLVRAPNVHGEPVVPRFVFLARMRRPPPSPTSGTPPMSACMLRISVVSLPCRYSHWHAADLRVRAVDIHGEPAMPLFVFPARMAPPAALPYLWHAADVRVHAADIRGESAMPLFALAGHRSPCTRCGHPRRARHAAIHFDTPSISSYTLRTFTASPPCCYSFWHAADLRVRAADICGEPAVPLFILAHHLFPRTRSERPWRARRAALRLSHSHGAARRPPLPLA
ncbi:hypothetical protein A0H81_13925 [Grifola frondosa]|uniref:Uncharacterized protein n=1 Tax=Grifola frondosa TaxID=5627 RepID=A0A1C7LMS1_GRIFR|nr:hypothetical protein A0H81_13925 [Grifola frondosa]